MASTIDLPKNVVRGKTRKNIVWPEGLKRLPNQFGLKATDLGFDANDLTRLAAKAAGGKDQKAIKVFNTTREVLLELMARDTEPRHVTDNSGNKVYFDHNGEPTVRKYSGHLTDQSGEYIEHEPVMEERSRWGIRAGRETMTAPGAEMPQPGHWKHMVEEHFDDLFGQLVFATDTPDTRFIH